ncbi:hypothetical protein ADL15_21920 [Actinoplanes awajinensis subsp. mycoplanecinus]|uniref:Uncharacterized protein n=1 Tax=Actinoplanes awajinensis subsp. mycoplanecinus TaxID=135947 RepID=A0A101JR45_9ACTN|nr:hypothetical protein ADL15_21920 [Actinoplanes awajinensis subsp. mycoplanecinus]
MPGHGPVVGFRGSFTDVDHVRDPAAVFTGAAPGFAQGPAGAQTGGEFPAQSTAALDIQRLVDRFVRHPHPRVVGVVLGQSQSDLFG